MRSREIENLQKNKAITGLRGFWGVKLPCILHLRHQTMLMVSHLQLMEDGLHVNNHFFSKIVYRVLLKYYNNVNIY